WIWTEPRDARLCRQVGEEGWLLLRTRAWARQRNSRQRDGRPLCRQWLPERPLVLFWKILRDVFLLALHRLLVRLRSGWRAHLFRHRCTQLMIEALPMEDESFPPLLDVEQSLQAEHVLPDNWIACESELELSIAELNFSREPRPVFADEFFYVVDGELNVEFDCWPNDTGNIFLELRYPGIEGF